jgi:murein DD-endopeptidase MepM/ murein hydrolase activator NlpD
LGLAPALSAAEPSAGEVLAAALAALGGEARLAELTSRETTGALEVSGLTGSWRSRARADGRLRLDIDLQVLQLERAFDGASGWERRNDSVTPVEGDALAALTRAALFQPLLSYHQRAVPVALLGREPVAEREAWVLEFQPRLDVRERFYLDTETRLPLREVHSVGATSGADDRTITYGDYRAVAGVMLPFSVVTEVGGRVQALTVAEYRLDAPMPDSLFANPIPMAADVPFEVTLSAIPHQLFKEDDGVWEEGDTESWVFHVLVHEAHGRSVEPLSAVLELRSGGASVSRTELSATALAALRGVRFTGLAEQKEVFDLLHYLSQPKELEIDRMVYRLRLRLPDGSEITKELEIPVQRYRPKSDLIFPLRGNFMVLGGHDFNEPHKGEWSQHYALDIVALGEHFELTRGSGVSSGEGSGRTNEDFVTWGAQVLAPADGVVVFARNDVPDNPRPGTIDLSSLGQLPDPVNAIAGNNVILDHGNGEYSLLGHLIQGSVRVESGQRVTQGQVLGLLGNSGNSDAPHLHYHLMAGPVLFQSDGLPARFGNVVLDLLGEPIAIPSPKRGIPLTAQPVGKE